jgi:flagellar protein FlgJ
MSPADITPSIFDSSGLAAIKRQAKSNDPAALKAAAQQFEALFLQMVLKSMRDATPKEGFFDSDQTRLYESLLDQQMSQVLAAKGGTGLAAVIQSQLSRYASSASDSTANGDGMPLEAPASPMPLKLPTRLMPASENAPPSVPVSSVRAMDSSVQTAAGQAATSSVGGNFVEKLRPHAADASRSSGIPAEFLLAQAALETGWGRSEPRRVDGQSSYNVFGIKAGRSWRGPTVEAATTEYVDGVAQQRVERFRAYGSYAEAFKDYANLLASNPRFSAVVGTTDATTFAYGLQRAGYATDPAYAEKLTRIIGTFPVRTILAA